jgi:hypothetical protein
MLLGSFPFFGVIPSFFEWGDNIGIAMVIYA